VLKFFRLLRKLFVHLLLFNKTLSSNLSKHG
jgi:hypothetical protein